MLDDDGGTYGSVGFGIMQWTHECPYWIQIEKKCTEIARERKMHIQTVGNKVRRVLFVSF